MNAELLASNPQPNTTGASSSGAFGAATIKKKKHHLSASSDGILSKLRDSNFAIVGSKLNSEARRLEAAYGVSVLYTSAIWYINLSLYYRVVTKPKLLPS